MQAVTHTASPWRRNISVEHNARRRHALSLVGHSHSHVCPNRFTCTITHLLFSALRVYFKKASRLFDAWISSFRGESILIFARRQ